MMEQKLGGIEGLIVFIDDILVYADTIETFRIRTSQVLAALRKEQLDS
jgi:hypothetical protein